MTKFYIDESPNGEWYFIDHTLVSQEDFMKRRRTECQHEFSSREFCYFCGKGRYNALWSEMTPAERLAQTATGITWDWMNQFNQNKVNEGLIKLANEVLRLRKKLKSLEAR